jgi:hypothetical protein
MTGLQTAILLGVGVLAAPAMPQCAADDEPMTYQIVRAPAAITFDAKWDGEFWSTVKPLELQHYMGERPAHFPKVQAKLVYDDHALFVMFRVQDRFVRAVAQQHQDAVYRDSCVEFFFTPQTDSALGYFNLEMNCGGTMLLYHQRAPGQDSVHFSESDLAQIDVKHSLPKIVDPEITEPTEWTVAYRLPVKMLNSYFPAEVQQPAPGVAWRANFYKCADETSHPHWLTWSPVAFDRPDFHRPQSFGRLEFQ